MIKIETLVSLLPKLFMGCVWSFDRFSIQLKIYIFFFFFGIEILACGW